MDIKVDFAEVEQWIEGFKEGVGLLTTDTEEALRAQVLSTAPHMSGNMEKALAAEGSLESSTGMFVISFADAEKLGEPGGKAPEHTISKFLAWYTGKPVKAPKNNANSKYAWWWLTPEQKDALQAARRGGMFGGETSIGVGRAPYFWVQEGSTTEGASGADKAAITPRKFVENAMEKFEDIVDAQSWRLGL